MCGIAGFIDSQSPAQALTERLETMLHTIRHRGPDGFGTYVQAPLAIGMCRLSIIDLEGGQQPIWNEDHTIGVVFNGEIYNYRELRAQLGAHTFTTNSDTEVLVHLYEAHGLQMGNQLRGMFAFAIIDLRQQRLVLFRDHFGQKPLYYHASARGFAFASEMKALFTLPWMPRDFCPDAFWDYVGWLSLPAPSTHFQTISKLQPAHYLVVPIAEPEASIATPYWHYDLSTPPDLEDLEEAAALLDRELETSLRLHLRADVPIGVMLSSGLDSRCIAAYAQPLQEGKLTTFSVGFASKNSELPGAARVASEIGSRHFALELNADDYAAGLEGTAWHLDEPIGDPAAFAVRKIAELASQHVKVLLSGEGADELFGGYDERYRGMLETTARTHYLRQWGRLLPEFLKRAQPQLGRLIERTRRSPAEEILALRREGLPGDVRHPRGLNQAQLSLLDRRQALLAAENVLPQRDRLSEFLTLDLRWQLAESLLQKSDKMTMAASIELRTPFLDVSLANLAARMHSELKLPAHGPGKAVLRRCLARRLPEDVARPKQGFPMPLQSWLRGPLRAQCEARLFRSNGYVTSLLDPILLRSAWNDFQAGNYRGAPVFHALWLYEIWREQLSRATPPASPA